MGMSLGLSLNLNLALTLTVNLTLTLTLTLNPSLILTLTTHRCGSPVATAVHVADRASRTSTPKEQKICGRHQTHGWTVAHAASRTDEVRLT